MMSTVFLSAALIGLFVIAPVIEAISKNPKAVADYKAGKDAAKMAIVGTVMKGNKGVPNDVVRKLVDEELAKG